MLPQILTWEGYREYETLGGLIKRSLERYGWNQKILYPNELLHCCKSEGILFSEIILGKGEGPGFYGTNLEGQPEILIDFDLSPSEKWYVLASTVSYHFVRSRYHARALASIALLPTWMLAKFSMEELMSWGYGAKFLQLRYGVWQEFQDVPSELPLDPEILVPRGSLRNYLNYWID